jgi:hypothetical protein
MIKRFLSATSAALLCVALSVVLLLAGGASPQSTPRTQSASVTALTGQEGLTFSILLGGTNDNVSAERRALETAIREMATRNNIRMLPATALPRLEIECIRANSSSRVVSTTGRFLDVSAAAWEISVRLVAPVVVTGSGITATIPIWERHDVFSQSGPNVTIDDAIRRAQDFVKEFEAEWVEAHRGGVRAATTAPPTKPIDGRLLSSSASNWTNAIEFAYSAAGYRGSYYQNERAVARAALVLDWRFPGERVAALDRIPGTRILECRYAEYPYESYFFFWDHAAPADGSYHPIYADFINALRVVDACPASIREARVVASAFGQRKLPGLRWDWDHPGL